MKLRLTRTAGGALLTSGNSILWPADNDTLNYIANLPDGTVFEVDVPKMEKKRTLTQNNCIHKYAEMLADALNSSGWYQMQFMQAMETGGEVPWTRETVKDNIWRKVQIAMTGKESTSKLSTVECSKIYEIVSSNVAKLSGVSVSWPNRFGD